MAVAAKHQKTVKGGEEATLTLVCVFPLLHLQYSADAKKVKFLLRAPLYFDLEMYNKIPWMDKVTDSPNCESLFNELQLILMD